MISNAQVAQLATKFITDVIQYKKNKKYVVNLCVESLYTSYFNYILSLSDCLDFETDCKLQKIADDLNYVDNDDVISCQDQLSITFSRNDYSCNSSLVLRNSLNSSNYPVFTVNPNSIYTSSSINLKNVSLCNTFEETIEGGCNSVTCSNSLKSVVSFTLSDYSIYLPSDGYITELEVYETDTNGNFINSPILLDLDPATSPYYSGAGLTTLVDTDVVFSNVNWANNMLTLMNNVSIFRYGVTGKHYLTFQKVLSGATFVRIIIVNKILNDPTQQIFGINKPTGFVRIYQPGPGNYAVMKDTDIIGITSTNFYYDDNVTTTCGNLAPIIDSTSRPKVSGGASNFNKLVLIDPYGDIALPLTGIINNQCSANQLVAIYNNSNVVSVSWQDPNDDVVSLTDTVVLTEDGSYVFTAVLENGCQVSKTYTYSIEESEDE